MGGGHTMQYADNVSWKCTLETYMILLTNVTPINFIRKKRKEIKDMRIKIEIKSWFFVFVFLMNVQSWSLRKSHKIFTSMYFKSA